MNAACEVGDPRDTSHHYSFDMNAWTCTLSYDREVDYYWPDTNLEHFVYTNESHVEEDLRAYDCCRAVSKGFYVTGMMD